VSELAEFNEFSKGVTCECCEEISYYVDEIVFLLGNEVVSVSEQHPDWDRSICTVCAEEKNII
jgi:hypothetical protein